MSTSARSSGWSRLFGGQLSHRKPFLFILDQGGCPRQYRMYLIQPSLLASIPATRKYDRSEGQKGVTPSDSHAASHAVSHTSPALLRSMEPQTHNLAVRSPRGRAWLRLRVYETCGGGDNLHPCLAPTSPHLTSPPPHPPDVGFGSAGLVSALPGP